MRAEGQIDNYAIAHIREALAGDERTAELNITAQIGGGRVLLTGLVASSERAEAVKTVVAEACPELEIEDGMTVEGPGDAGPVEPEELS